MIVKTKTDDFGNNTIGLNNPFKGLFNGDFFKRQNLLSDADITAIKAYNTEIDKCVTSQTAFKEYSSHAQDYLNKAVSLGAISSSLAQEIKSRVADGSINISKYSSDIQTVISTYKDWIDKAKDCTTAMQTLHDSLRTYAEDLKKVSDAQRDARNKIKSNLKCNVQITYNPTVMIGYGYKS